MTDDPMGAVLVQLARRKGDRAAKVLDAVFDDYGFAVRGDPARGTEIARQCRAIGPGTGDFATDLASVAVAVLTHFGYPHDPAEVHAAVRRHLGDGHGTLPPDARP